MSPMYLDYFVNTTSPMYNFDVDSEHEDHSEELLLFVGCIVNFIVSYLICMFQDSVPAGSYKDPFLSSVCVCVVCVCVGVCVCVVCVCWYDCMLYVKFVCVGVCVCVVCVCCVCVGVCVVCVLV